jgi:hypothetical protein
MANVFAPYGFIESYRLGGAPTEQPNKRNILSTNSTPIYFGDPVIASRHSNHGVDSDQGENRGEGR